jgi:sulfur carrier protein ThiS
VLLARTGTSAVSLPMTVLTTSETRPLSADPAPQGQPQLVTALRTGDKLLDAMAFSRGRFAVEVNGLPTLYLPAWTEVGRVIEDCRG